MKDRRPVAESVVFVLVPIAVALIVVFMLVSEHDHVDHDLQLFVQTQARPGQRLAMRAMLLDEIARPEGPRTRSLTVDVRLVDHDGRAAARARLAPTPVRTSEGDLAVPRSARGAHRVVARTVLPDGREATVVAPLRVDPGASPPEPIGRLAMPLQRWAQYPLLTAGADPSAGPPPDLLETRAVGGACVPELRCELLVLVGTPAAAVHVERSAAVTPVSPAGTPAEERSGVHALTVITHGPEAAIDVVATRGGREVARRPMRLPVALGALVLRAEGPLLEQDRIPHLRAEGASGRSGIIVDAYRDGFWERTVTVPTRRAGSDGFDPPFAPLDLREAGRGVVWRIQARLDPFGSGNAAVRLLYVHPRGEAPARTRATVRAWARAQDLLDASATAALDAEPDLARAVAFALAPAELDLMPQPLAMSGHAQALAGGEGDRTSVRVVGVLALILVAIFVALFAARRGLDAAAQARALMAEAGDPGALDQARRRRQTLTVLMLSAAVLLAFLAVAAMVVSRF